MKKIKVHLIVATLAVICALTMSVTPASANSITVNFVSVSAPVAGVFTYTYRLENGMDSYATTTPAVAGGPGGTFFTMYDFIGYVAGSANITGLSGALGVAGNWAIATQLLGKTPGLIGPDPVDNPGVLNVVFTWTGAATPVALGSQGTFTLQSTVAAGVGPNMAWSGNVTSTNTGLADRSTGTEIGPVVVTPEPTSLILLGTGLAGLAVAIRRRK